MAVGATWVPDTLKVTDTDGEMVVLDEGENGTEREGWEDSVE